MQGLKAKIDDLPGKLVAQLGDDRNTLSLKLKPIGAVEADSHGDVNSDFDFEDEDQGNSNDVGREDQPGGTG
jgi:hypothetical protein